MVTIKRNVLSAMVVLFGTALAGTDLRAQDLANGWVPSALEVSKLPGYCQRFFLQKALPANCDGVHHLCAGKVLINRAMDFKIPKQERQRILNNAKNEVDYIFGRNNPSCQMMSEARATQNHVRMLQNIQR